MENRDILKMRHYITSMLPILAIVFFASILRLIPHPPNVAPIAALALFGGVYFDKKYALIVPLIAMLLTDMLLGFHASMPAVYGSFLLTGFLGMWIRKKKTFGNMVAASLLSSCIFFLLTNFNYWLSNNLYPKTWEGQLQAYYYALPFFRNTIVGDLFYTGLFFGSYELMCRILGEKIPALKRNENLHQNRR